MDVWKRGETPPLPRSREGNENPKSHCHENYVTGRRVSRQPEAGKPIHHRSSRGGVLRLYYFSYLSHPVLQAPHFGQRIYECSDCACETVWPLRNYGYVNDNKQTWG